MGDTLVLEGRLLGTQGRGPTTLIFARLHEREPPRTIELTAVMARVRAAAAGGIHRYLPEPQASLAIGVLLGGAGNLDADFRLELERSGLAHIVAIDGYKQVVVAAALGAVAVRLFGVRAAALPILLGIAGYTLLTGAHPSAVRAGLMVGLASLASLMGRVADPLTSLVLAALLMATVEPSILLDVGLQLSLSAVLGIVLLWPRLRGWLHGLPNIVAEPAGLTLAVTLATLPVALSVFQTMSLVSPLAHVLAVPLLPLVMVSAAVLACASPVEPLAGAVAWLAWLPSTLMVSVVEVFGGLPGAALSTGRLPPLAAGCLATALLAWGLWQLPEAAPLRLAWARVRATAGGGWAPATSLAACVVSLAVLLAVRPDGRLHVYSLGTGRGEAVMIRGPTGQTALVVSGRVDARLLANHVAQHLALWEHKLDSVVRLDESAEASLSATLARYAAGSRLNAARDARLDLGGGAALDVYAADDEQPQPSEARSQSPPSGAQPTNGRTQDRRTHDGRAQPGVSTSFGRVWVRLIGRPPPPIVATDGGPPVQASSVSAAELVSDGEAVWTVSDADGAH